MTAVLQWMEPALAQDRAFPGRLRLRWGWLALWLVIGFSCSLVLLWMDEVARRQAIRPIPLTPAAAPASPSASPPPAPVVSSPPNERLVHLALVAGFITAVTALMASPLMPGTILITEDSIIRRVGCLERHWRFSETGWCFLAAADAEELGVDADAPLGGSVLVLERDPVPLPSRNAFGRDTPRRRARRARGGQALLALPRDLSPARVRRVLRERGLRVE